MAHTQLGVENRKSREKFFFVLLMRIPEMIFFTLVSTPLQHGKYIPLYFCFDHSRLVSSSEGNRKPGFRFLE